MQLKLFPSLGFSSLHLWSHLIYSPCWLIMLLVSRLNISSTAGVLWGVLRVQRGPVQLPVGGEGRLLQERLRSPGGQGRRQHPGVVLRATAWWSPPDCHLLRWRWRRLHRWRQVLGRGSLPWFLRVLRVLWILRGPPSLCSPQACVWLNRSV